MFIINQHKRWNTSNHIITAPIDIAPANSDNLFDSEIFSLECLFENSAYFTTQDQGDYYAESNLWEAPAEPSFYY